MTEKPKLLDQVRQVIRVKNYSYRTEQAYVTWIKRYIHYHDKRHPKMAFQDTVYEHPVIATLFK